MAVRLLHLVLLHRLQLCHLRFQHCDVIKLCLREVSRTLDSIQLGSSIKSVCR